MAEVEQPVPGRKRSLSGSHELFSIIGLIAIFALLNRVMLHAAKLPVTSYEEPFVFAAMLRNIPRLSWTVLVGGLILLAFLPFSFRMMRRRWTDLEYGHAIRIVVTMAAIILTWSFTTYRQNYYFGQSHAVDRFLIAGLCACVILRPVFVLPFLAVLLPVASQFHQPIANSYMTVPLLPIRILILFAAMLLLQSVTRSRVTNAFVFVLLCVWAGHYFPSGLGKLRLSWFTHEQIEFLLPTTYANGWLGFLSVEQINSVTQTVGKLNTPMKVFTLLLEAGSLAFLVRRSFTLAFLAGWIALHAGIFAISGICFSHWVVMAATMWIVLWKYPSLYEYGVPNRWRIVASIPLIASAPIWTGSASLSWFDASATYTCRFEAVDANGARYRIAPSTFAPYNTVFAMSLFHGTSHQRVLPISWGSTRDVNIIEQLQSAQNASEVLGVEDRLGIDLYREQSVGTLRELLVRFIRAANGGETQGSQFRDRLRAPPYICTFSPENSWSGQQPIERIVVSQVFSCFCDGQYQELREEVVLEVEASGILTDRSE